MLTLPIVAEPSQRFNVDLGGQQCLISLYQRAGITYMDLTLNSVLIIAGAVCRDRVSIIRHAYLGFVGALRFVDTQGINDPEYTGLGTRYKLVYQS